MKTQLNIDITPAVLQNKAAKRGRKYISGAASPVQQFLEENDDDLSALYPLEAGIELCSFCGPSTPTTRCSWTEKSSGNRHFSGRRSWQARHQASSQTCPRSSYGIATMGIYSPVWYLTRAQSKEPHELPPKTARLRHDRPVGPLPRRPEPPGAWEDQTPIFGPAYKPLRVRRSLHLAGPAPRHPSGPCRPIPR